MITPQAGPALTRAQVRHRPSRRYGRELGFTLTELLTVVAIAAILAAVALPNMAEFIKNNARSTRLNDLVTAVNFARSTAVTQRRRHLVCATTDGLTCSGAVQFGTGVLVMGATVDAPGLPPTGANAGDWALVRALTGSTGAQFALTGDAAFVAFEPSGMKSTTTANVKFVHCDDRGASDARAVVLSATGHPNISTDATGNGIDDVNGVDLTCPVI